MLCFLADFVSFFEYFKFDKESRAFEGRRATRRLELRRQPVHTEPEKSPATSAVKIGSPGRTSARAGPPEHKPEEVSR